MSYQTRKTLYKEVAEIRNKPLISYVTSIRPNLGGHMAGDAISQIIEQIENIPSSEKSIDFLIVSNGGDPITALRIIELLRERFDQISVLLPYVAYSAATILSLGADEIIMHPFSNLGPVDPQLTVTRNNGQGLPEQLNFGSEDLRNYIDFIKSDVGISDQQHLVSAIGPLLKEVGSLPIGRAKRGQQLSLSLSEKMLCTHIFDKNKARSISKALNSSYYHHGYAVSRKEAIEIGLNIVQPEEKLAELIWNIWKDFSAEMKCESAFDVIKELMSNPQSYETLSKIPVINLPANTPPEFAQQIIMQQAQLCRSQMQSPIRLRELVASIESINLAKAFYTNIDIHYWRNFDHNLGFNCTSYPSDWI